MATVTIEVGAGGRCDECGRRETVNGAPLCLNCVAKAIEGKPMKSEFGKQYAQKVRADLSRRGQR